MVNPETIQDKLAHLNRYINFLKDSKKYTLEEFLSNMMIHGAIERYLQLSIEVTIDIGNHVIATENMGDVHWNRDISTIFYEQGYVSKELCDTWINMIKFRNLLVHEYGIIDKKQVFKILHSHLTDLVALQEMFTRNFL
jgi:uncharacterized protein YutE (UPF0331/DUF86 family)